MQVVTLIRDISIILLAVVSIIVGILMVLLILEIRNLINTLQRDVKPILDSVNETASTVKGTTDFVSERVVRPSRRGSWDGRRRPAGVRGPAGTRFPPASIACVQVGAGLAPAQVLHPPRSCTRPGLALRPGRPRGIAPTTGLEHTDPL